jgi:hypothetical protein
LQSQFGKTGDDEFTMDYTYPFNAVQVGAPRHEEALLLAISICTPQQQNMCFTITCLKQSGLLKPFCRHHSPPRNLIH